MKTAWDELGADLFAFYDDSCTVYLLRYGDCALVIDFATGRWLDHLGEIGVRHVEHVVLTHAHRDQCCGLYRGRQGAWTLHVPAGDRPLLDAQSHAAFWTGCQNNGCPSNYAAPRLPLPHAVYDLQADGELELGPVHLCAIATPGHTRGALTYLVAWRGRDIAFCGDALCGEGAVHQPYHLEWDHWTGGGALAAWHGLERLGYCHIDLLLPSHGAPIMRRAGATIKKTQRNLMGLLRAKGSVCAGAKNRWWPTEAVGAARRVLPHLYHFGANSFLLVSEGGEGFVVDPQRADIEALAPLVDELGIERISAATATHYHSDHSDGLNYVRAHWGAAVWLHPWVAEPLRDRNRLEVPWLPTESIEPDRVLPNEGRFRWNEYAFSIRPFPGQTWWHCAFDASIDGEHVLFSGDNFQPPSRWNGTGGFCAFNGSRFVEGFQRSAQAVLDMAPSLICNGHGCIYPFSADQYRRILRWSARAEDQVRALCASDDWRSVYDPRALRLEPFVQRVRPGRTVQLTFVVTNTSAERVDIEVDPIGPSGWTVRTDRTRLRVAADATRTLRWMVSVPRAAVVGRYICSVDVRVDGHLRAEACAALVDVER